MKISATAIALLILLAIIMSSFIENHSKKPVEKSTQTAEEAMEVYGRTWGRFQKE